MFFFLFFTQNDGSFRYGDLTHCPVELLVGRDLFLSHSFSEVRGYRSLYRGFLILGSPLLWWTSLSSALERLEKKKIKAQVLLDSPNALGASADYFIVFFSV